MVSFQFFQGINAKSLARKGKLSTQALQNWNHENIIKSPNFKLSKRDFSIKRQIKELQLNEKRCYGIKIENPINGCCSKSIKSTK